ncbi:hypothetical protein PVAND_010214 [Polypedilum vanderplanki]|uniref:Uncharacterized protein n=1 Tax=Polypedilum vanderplanki TaxID=319348 RepID=A0A9J6CF68_POLVA|nr:hypothetical protein PVAND_010214 [Polypedilum vanderplanki]
MATLPSNFLTCPRNLPNVADCVKHAIEVLRPQITTGQFGPNLITDESLNPLIIGDVNVQRTFNMKLTNLRIFGMANFKIEKLRINTEKFKLEMIISIPRIDGTANYSMRMMIALLNLQGNGSHDILMENVRAHVKMIGSRYVRNNVEYLKIDSCEVRIKAAKLKVYFDNLFNGQKALERTANDVINQNIELITGEVYPIIENVMAQKLLKISNIIFNYAPFDEFFPIDIKY